MIEPALYIISNLVLLGAAVIGIYTIYNLMKGKK